MLQQNNITITVLWENSVAGPTGLIGEHEWAVGINDKNKIREIGIHYTKSSLESFGAHAFLSTKISLY